MRDYRLRGKTDKRGEFIGYYIEIKVFSLLWVKLNKNPMELDKCLRIIEKIWL